MSYKYIAGLFLLFLITSCSVSKQIPADKVLINSSNIVFKNPELIHKKKKLKTELELLVKPELNYGVGKSQLWLHYKFKTPKTKGLRYWVQNKLGKKPVYFEEKVTERNRLVLERRLKDKGYFGSKVSVDTSIVNQKMSVNFQVTSKGIYQIRNIHYPTDTVPLAAFFHPVKKRSSLKPGDYYSKINIDQERSTIYENIGQNGFIDFPESAIHFYIDTLVGNRQLDIYIKNEVKNDSTLLSPYHMGKTYIFPDYALDSKIDSLSNDTIRRKKFTIIQNWEVLKPKVFEQVILQKEGDLLNRAMQNNSASQLLDLGVFKFINTKYEKRFDGNGMVLDRYLYLTPSLPQTVSTEFQVNNRTGNFFGTAATFSYNHRNFLGGAERLEAKISGGVETQFGSGNALINTIDLSPEISLSFPRIRLLFRSLKTSGKYSPHTVIKLGNNLQKRTDYFTINALSTTVSYDWKSNNKISHIFSPIRLFWVNLIDKTSAFEDILSNDPRLENSFDNVFILGFEYTHLYNSQNVNTRKPYLSSRTKISTSGNLAGLFAKADGTDPTKKLWGVAYAQFFKLVPEIRYYVPHRRNLLASRLILGLGIPYGNSKELPYLEQFFVGGSNSLRAFPLRRLGPGSYVDQNNSADNQYLDQTGDIKLELNLEYRYDIFSYLKGAVFLDLGNVWLLNSDDRPQGVFNFNRFYKEIAVGTGTGFRLDFDFFVIRLDAAFPLHAPNDNQEFKWTFNNLKFLDKDWRNDNLIWNLAIGYPF